VSTDVRTVPDGSLSVRTRSVEPDGIASTVARTDCPAVAVNGMLATGAAAVISPVVLTSVSVRPAGVPPIGSPPDIVACDLRWWPGVLAGGWPPLLSPGSPAAGGGGWARVWVGSW